MTYKVLYKKIASFIGKNRVIVSVPMLIAKIFIGIAEKTPFAPMKLEQLGLFERDNIKRGVDKDFNYFKIKPQDTIGIIKKIIEN